MTSSRLPGKVLTDIGGRPALEAMTRRLGKSRRLDGLVIATTTNSTDDALAELAGRLSISVYRGDEADVLGRVAEAAAECDADIVVRLTADCPMIDPQIVDAIVELLLKGDCDYASNILVRTFPDGLDAEAVYRNTLEEANAEATAPASREHVTPFIHGAEAASHGRYRLAHHTFATDFSHVRWTLDTPKDLDCIRRLVSVLPEDYGWLDALAAATREPDLLGLGNAA